MYTTDDLARKAEFQAALGVDAAGVEHYVDTGIGPIGVAVAWAMDGDEVTRHNTLIEGSTDDDLSAYVQWVREGRGWDELHYDDRPTGEWLADQLTGGESA